MVQIEEGEEEAGWETASEGHSDSEEEKQKRSFEQANSAKEEGNKVFGAGKYEDALEHYTNALEKASLYPSMQDLQAICHSNRAACYIQLVMYKEAVEECTKALEINPKYIRALLRRAQGHEKLCQFEEAIADMQRVIELDPGNKQAREKIRQLEPLAAEKREKLKEEMLGKMKELGNSVLGKFGMSLDNFKAVKDPNTGSYSVSFQP